MSLSDKISIIFHVEILKRGKRVSNDESLNLKETLVDEKNKNQFMIEKLAATENEKCEVINVLNSKEKQVKALKLNLKRTAARETYAQKKVLKLEENINRTCCRDNQNLVKDLQKQIIDKEQEIRLLQENLEYVTNLLEDIDNENRVVDVYDEKSRKYTSKFKNCVYELLKLNVSASKVGDVVKSVLKLVSVEPNRLPATSTVFEMNLQRLCLAQKQLGEVFSKEEHTCLMTDETSKFDNKFMGYEATDTEGNFWVLGLREIETKYASNTLSVLKEILEDLDCASKCSNSETSRDIVAHITATMSDRAATEVKFNDLLSTYRTEVLPLVYSNYETFTEDEKNSMESLNNYFCGLHALVNYAESTQKCILEVENSIFDNESPIYDKSFRKSYEPGTCRLVRVASKAFGVGSGGEEKSGCQGAFRTYIHDFLHDNHLTSVPLKSYRGSRFNILFANAASVYFLHEHMLRAENRLLKSILFDLEVHEYVAGLKALGLISKMVTSPLWCILEDRNVSMVDMNAKYLELVTFLQDAANNTEQFMNGDLQIFNEHVKRDCIYDYIVRPNGKLVECDVNKVKGVPKTSCFAESIFGQLDHLMRTKPHLKTIAAESCIMFLNNRTSDWLNSKDEVERNKLIHEASKEVKSVKLKYKARIHEIENNRRIAMQEKIQKKESLDRERLRIQEKCTSDIVHFGLWQSEFEVDNMLATYNSITDKINALKAQLKFRQKVLLQLPEEKKAFNVTKSVDGKRKSLSVEELSGNLKSIVRQAIVRDVESNVEKHILLGKRVRHRFKENRNGQTVEAWYTGCIISQVPSFPAWFNIVYDGDEAVYTYHRLDSDIESDDLEILKMKNTLLPYVTQAYNVVLKGNSPSNALQDALIL
ncbi:hypothetical protein MAR_004802 [Mya arenaria]|uniref:Uncharacterized protein n=1 Tax=Mya arenaria TaxID=6604 RepID=A0ABY7F0S1_MYAAR|nr:hypothetical protein MAR_004802 [Mya arenaria]